MAVCSTELKKKLSHAVNRPKNRSGTRPQQHGMSAARASTKYEIKTKPRCLVLLSLLISNIIQLISSLWSVISHIETWHGRDSDSVVSPVSCTTYKRSELKPQHRFDCSHHGTSCVLDKVK